MFALRFFLSFLFPFLETSLGASVGDYDHGHWDTGLGGGGRWRIRHIEEDRQTVLDKQELSIDERV